jgi:3' terminal RNA ribose 2'-O-methyltransferase Hen1
VLLTLTTTHRPATDLGYLLAKHPDRTHSFELSFGAAHVFYPQADEARCTAALLLDLNPLDLVRRARQRKDEDDLHTQYVNDRPYAASSFLSVAINRVLGTALAGRSKQRQELADTAIPLEATISALPARGGERFLRELFEPLGYEIELEREPLYPHFESWGPSRYYQVTLRATKRLAELLAHIYVLVPVLDDDKHYWVDDSEVDKLLDKAGDWLKTHPLREEISSRYLKRQRRLTREALARLAVDEGEPPDESDERNAAAEEQLETKVSLDAQRLTAVLAILREAGAKRVIDVGCGEGKLVRALLRDRSFERVAGMDVSLRALENAADRLRLEQLPDRVRARVELFQGSLTYRDQRLSGYDAACAIEVIEHLDPSRLTAFERVLFEYAAPTTVVVTTPNVEHNVRFESLPAGKFRHHDHRFEWTRAEFCGWASTTAERNGYDVRMLPIGPEDPEVGPPTQMAVFTRRGLT